MVSELTHLETIIIRTEDSLFLVKTPYEIEEIQSRLKALRLKHHKMVREQKGRGVL